MNTQINGKTIRVIKEDITDLKVECMVYYASPDLKLGTGFGSMISRRGGNSISNELKDLPEQEVGSAVVTSAGKLKPKCIIHAVGPAFSESDIKKKLKKTVESALNRAEERGAQDVAFPAMGFGFHGIPISVSAEAMKEAIVDFAQKDSCVREILICVNDSWVAEPYLAAMASTAAASTAAAAN
jgi:O-acetyl-ADP-ribose deacetylase (regulator of RNase III)